MEYSISDCPEYVFRDIESYNKYLEEERDFRRIRYDRQSIFVEETFYNMFGYGIVLHYKGNKTYIELTNTEPTIM